jgi:glyoxylase-like metal-dependent hydrolase (beta-lactamase superfamily II)
MKLAKNVALLPITREGMGAVNLVLAWDDKHLVLVDAGLPGQIDEIKDAIANEGFRAENLTHLILTHQDWDHLGCVSDFLNLAPNLQVIAHEKEAPYIDGREMPIKLSGRLERYDELTEAERASTDWWRNLYENSPIKITLQVQDGHTLPICGGIKLVHVPGHTPGHLAVYFQESRIIVCGDAANLNEGKIVGSNPIYTQDMALAEKSLEKIKSHDISGIVTYHTGFLALN